MAQFGREAERFRQAGIQVVFIAAQKRGGMFKPEKFLQHQPAPFPFLLDEDRAVTRQYGVYHRLGLDAWRIAHPATFVVDRAGVVRWIFIGSTQLDRAPLEQVLAEAEQAK